MRWLRRSSRLTSWLVVALGLAFLLPEIGHSLAHRYAMADTHATAQAVAAHSVADHDHPEATAAAPGLAVLTGGDHSDAHPHCDQRGPAPGKLSLASLFAAQVVVDLTLDADSARQVHPPVTWQIVLTGRSHGPPSSSRAPPLS